ncbi:InlB B-repeat-containing protein [Haloimpatiens sp. FM7315]|uniref:InlB B-repeat-containing protein n=1 Tax=Haloimpatiens sp. FM7315 TaxID=3298609 RepID=UPI0035A289EA
MKYEIIKKVISVILSLSLTFHMGMWVVYGSSEKMPTVDGRTIFANGTPLLIVADGNGTTIYIDTNASGVIDPGEKSLKDAGIANAPKNGENLEYYGIYGGGNRVNVQYNTHIVMTGGHIDDLFGGCYTDYNSKGGDLTGDTYIKVTGGKVHRYIRGGSCDTRNNILKGNTTVIVTGGTAGYDVSCSSNWGKTTGIKTGIVTSTKANEIGFHNGFLKTAANVYIAKGTITLPSDFEFTLPKEGTLTVQEGAVIKNQGKITLNGTMENKGTFINNGIVKSDGGKYSGSGIWNGNPIEDLNLTVSEAKEITDNSTKFTVNCNKDARVYYLASETPINDKNILEAKGNSQSVSSNIDSDILLQNLKDDTSYTYYMVAKSGENFTDIKTVSFKTLQKSPLSGTGTKDDPYIIKTDFDLEYLANSVKRGQSYSSKYLKLNNDITYSSIPIGCFTEGSSTNMPFCGNFDAAGHTVTLAMTNASSNPKEAVALFGYLGSGASIKNICTTGTITSKEKYSGGIAGVARDGNVNFSSCSSSVEMNFTKGGDCTYGGIVGLINNLGNVTMTNCCFTGKITSSATSLEGVGGLCGWKSDTLNAINCYVNASFGSNSITAKGQHMARNGGTFTNCYYNKENRLTDDGSANSAGSEAVTNDFTRGKITWLLQNGQSNPAIQVWGQRLTGNITDSDPVLSLDSIKAVHKVSYFLDNKELENIRGYANSSMTLANFTLTEAEINEGYKYNFEITSGTATLDTANNQLKDIGGDVVVTVTKGIFYTITAKSKDLNLGTVGEGGAYAAGATATFIAEPRMGCKFVKWTSDAEGNTEVSKEKTFTVKASKSCTYYAWFTIDKYTLSVGDFNSSAGTITGVKDEGYSYNERAVLKAEANTGYVFDGWKNEYGVTVDTSPNFSFNVSGNMTITPIFTQIKENVTYYRIAFYHQAGNLLKSEKIALNTGVTVPNTPSKIGYEFIGWSADGTNPIKLNEDGSITITSNMDLRPLFRVKEVKYSLTVNDILKDSYAPLSSVKAEVTETSIPEGKKFAYWIDKEGNILSYSNPYNFSITCNMELKAIYEDLKNDVIKKPTLTLSEPTYEFIREGKHKMVWYAVMDLPEGYTMVESGILRIVSTVPKTNDQMTFDSDGIYKRVINVSDSIPNQYYYSVAATDGKGVSIRAYIVIRNKDGNLETILSDVQYGCYK